MLDKPAKCPKCNDLMEEGISSAFFWGPVPPPSASWLQFLMPRRVKPVVRGLRCKGCGYLELYTKP